MISPEIKGQIASYAKLFKNAAPYRHVCLDNFFESAVVDRILEDFPDFDRTDKLNEFGNNGVKAVEQRLSEISPFYAQMVKYFHSKEFHDLIGQISGIDDLRWGGETMYGGGTHENINGSDLDPHVDFNYFDETKEHRRLNLLIYLNRDWEPHWGGEFELHSDPRDPENNQVICYQPIINRAVLMETTEHSWHGFPRINLPPDKLHLSRRSLALYFYTKDRPKEEIHGGHATFYIQRPLPDEFQIGATVTADLYKEIHYLVSKRDGFLKLAQNTEKAKALKYSQLEQQYEFLLARHRLPVLGWATQINAASGYYPDGWVMQEFAAEFCAARNLKSIILDYMIPEYMLFPLETVIEIGEQQIRRRYTESEVISQLVPVKIASNEQFNITIKSSTCISALDAGINQDERAVSLLLINITFEGLDP